MRWHVKALCERAAVREDCVLYANMPLEVVHSAKAAPAAATVAVLVGGGRLVQNSSKFHKCLIPAPFLGLPEVHRPQDCVRKGKTSATDFVPLLYLVSFAIVIIVIIFASL